jgi:micrococcal nuclease
MKVRLAGIIVPQGPRIEAGQGQTCNRRARKYLTELIKNKVVDVKAYGLDEKDRIVAEVYFGGLNINLEMIRAGMATVDPIAPPVGFDLKPYWRFQDEARKARRGIWAIIDK